MLCNNSRLPLLRLSARSRPSCDFLDRPSLNHRLMAPSSRPVFGCSSRMLGRYRHCRATVGVSISKSPAVRLASCQHSVAALSSYAISDRAIDHLSATILSRQQSVPIYVPARNQSSIGRATLLGNLRIQTHSLSGPHPSRDTMLACAFTKLAGAFQYSTGTKGSVLPIESEQEILLSNLAANKRLKINACGQLYAKLSETKPSLFRYAPKSGIDFVVNYYDSLELLEPETRSKAPTVCLLHGAPGHYKDYAQLIGYLSAKGIRVLAPNFPEYSATFEHSFRHTPCERADYLLQFFQALGLSKLDMLVGHSSAVYTIFELLHTDSSLQVNSLGLFNTPTYNLPTNIAPTPARLFTLRLFDYPIIRPLMSTLIHIFARLQGIQNRVDRDKVDNLLVAASAMGYSNSERMADQLKLVHKCKIPTFVLIGCKDRLISMDSFEQLKRDLGVVDDKQIKCYQDDGQVAKDVNEYNELVEVSQFSSGGHYTFQRFSIQVSQDVYDFLRRKVLPVESTKL